MRVLLLATTCFYPSLANICYHTLQLLPLVSSNFSLLPHDDDGDGEQVGYEGSQGLGGALYEGRERLVSMAVGALHI